MEGKNKPDKSEKIKDTDAAADNAVVDSVEVVNTTDDQETDAGNAITSDNKTDELTEARNRIDLLTDKLLRTAAEFENYKKRNNAEKAELLLYANEKLIRELLPVLDDFERAVASYQKDSNADALYKGAILIYEKLRAVLERQGLKEIESDGREFDVKYHDAVLQQISEQPPNTILETVEKGYTLRDRVIRHAKVIVSVQGNTA
jgi:molecular chaperone GrpE